MLFTPASTYRIQFHKDFKFCDLLPHIPYLADLGISTIYASPIFAARPGSTHGYDVTNAQILNPEIGTIEEFDALQAEVKKHGMTWLQDIVPNHMAFDQCNKWLMDVFEKGSYSEHYRTFDINWNHPDPTYNGKFMAPFLGAPLDKAIASGDIKIAYSELGFVVKFYDNTYSISMFSWPELLKYISANSNGNSDLQTIAANFHDFAIIDISEEKAADWEKQKSEFLKSVKGNPDLQKMIQHGIEKLNKDHIKLTQILQQQFFRLEFWKVTDSKINFRRFFTINELLCLRIESIEVFDAYHKFILELYQKGYFQGLRIDHVDGLLDPLTYLNRLREAAGPGCYITVEKILELAENLPESWPVQGTTGYFFLAILNQLFTDSSAEKQFDAIYHNHIGEKPDYEAMVFEKKIYMLENHMQGELDNLLTLMHDLNLKPKASSIPEGKIKQALKILLASFPVYRLYPQQLPVTGQDAEILEKALARAAKHAPELSDGFNYFRQLFQGEQSDLPGKPEDRLYFLQRNQQFTGPLAAKGVEDTTFYNYNRLISHNEVGDTPEVFGISIERFHKEMQSRQRDWPLAQNATATHDTKRGEDARVRLNVLTELPGEWQELLATWEEKNQQFLGDLNGEQVPSANRVFFLYQALLGAFPMNGETEENFLERIKEAMTKAMREAKMSSNWTEPNEKYEAGVHEFSEAIFADYTDFKKTFLPFVKKLSFYGMLYSLGQTLLKITAPGIPDIYQGCELWDLSMVDPDNRRPVNYALRKQYLNELKTASQNAMVSAIRSMQTNWSDGRLKLFTTWKALQFRKENRDLFTHGAYLPLQIKTSGSGRIIGFARHFEDQWCLVLAPLAVTKLSEAATFPLGEKVWKKEAVLIPDGAPINWKNLFTGEEISGNGSLSLAQVFASFPVALLTSE